MKILVCFKVVPDLDQLSVNDWELQDHNPVHADYVQKMINPYDESALELILKLRDAALINSVPIHLTALTIGSDRTKRVLKNLYALKYDRAVQVDCDLDLKYNAQAIAALIYQSNQQILESEVIVLGQESNEGQNSQTPFILAEKLAWPCINSVIEIKLSPLPGYLEVVSRIEQLEIIQTVQPPLILAVGNAAHSNLRVPTLKDKMQLGKKEIMHYPVSDLNISPEEIAANCDCQLVTIAQEKRQRDCVFINEETPHNAVKKIFNDYLRERINAQSH